MVDAAKRPHGGARGLARRAVRAQVSVMTLELCVQNGYDSTTVDDICAVAGISRSTFFRYFTSKDDALLGDVDKVGHELLDALTQRPDHEPVWVSLRHAFGVLVRTYASEPERSRQLVELMDTVPTLAAAHLGKHARWMPVLRPEIARRIGLNPDDPADPRPGALMASALACADATLTAWIAGEADRELTEILAEAMGAMTQ